MSTAAGTAVPLEIHYTNTKNSHDDIIFAMETHPSSDLLTLGDIHGQISLYSFTAGEECKCMWSINHSTGRPCRVARFSRKGEWLCTAAKDHRSLFITDTERGTLIRKVPKAVGATVYSLCTMSETLLSSGDEDGEIKLWDTRSWKEVLAVKENSDYISAIVADNKRHTLLATSGDGSLTVVDLRSRKFEQKSDCCESELTCLAIAKGGRKVICGDGDGVLGIYTWNLWGDVTDRFVAHPLSVDSMTQLSESVVCTGCMDGKVRAIQIQPNQVMGVIGEHEEGFPVDNLCLNHDHTFLISSSQSSCKFWCVDEIPKMADQKEEDMEDEEEEKRKKRKKRKRPYMEAEQTEKDDFFADL